MCLRCNTRNRSLATAASALALTLAAPATRADDGSIVVRGRLTASWRADARTPAFPWDLDSRSGTSESRLMLDALTPERPYGSLYLKGAGKWGEAEVPDGHVAFEVEQGDYLWKRSLEKLALSLRAFANERRYFAGELTSALVADDRVARYDDHFGARVDISHGRRLGVHYLGTGLYDGEEIRSLHVVGARYCGRYAGLGLSYLYDVPTYDTRTDHAVVRAEGTLHYDRATLIVAHEQSGFGSGFFVPAGDFAWSDFDGGNYSRIAPRDGASEMKLRASGIPVGDGDVRASYHYRAVGVDYRNDLSHLTPGEVEQRAALYWSHRARALDTRLVYHDRTLRDGPHYRTRTVSASARAFLRVAVDLSLRGGAGEVEDGDRRDDVAFVHGSARRTIRELEGAVHAMALGTGGHTEGRYGAEASLNIGSHTTLYGRWLVRSAPGGTNDAARVRLAFRPTPAVWVALGYGGQARGDGPFLLEDPDLARSGGPERVYTVTVRGDF